MRAEEQNQAEYETHPFSNHSIAQLLRSLEACLQEAARHLFFLVQTFICYGDKRKKEGRKEGRRCGDEVYNHLSFPSPLPFCICSVSVRYSSCHLQVCIETVERVERVTNLVCSGVPSLPLSPSLPLIMTLTETCAAQITNPRL
jgi:hypothetical protein